MFPENRLSTTLVANAYTFPYTLTPPNTRTAYAMGGVGLSDPSQGMDVQLWTATALEDRVILEAPNMPNALVALSMPDITQLTLAFDQNMNYVLCFVQYNVTKLYWYDSFEGEYIITEFPGASTPRVTLDDRRVTQTANSDVVLAYIKDNNLYFRLQRDRFQNEYLLAENLNARLEQMGMNVRNRLQFRLKPFRTSA